MDKKNVDRTNNKEKEQEEKIEKKSYYDYDFEDMGYFDEMKLWEK